MAFSLYDATIGVTETILDSLTQILNKAEEQPNADKFPSASLYEDHKPLTFNVFAATNFVQMLANRLAGKEPTQFEDDMQTFADMHKRIATARDLLKQTDRDTVNRLGEEVAVAKLPFGDVELSGRDYAMGLCMPNINFHISVSYSVLRKEGVPLGKRDYLGPFLTGYNIINSS